MCDAKNYNTAAFKELQDQELICRLRFILDSQGFQVLRKVYPSCDDMAILAGLVQQRAMQIDTSERRVVVYTDELFRR